MAEYPLTQRDPIKAKYSPFGTRTYHNPARIRERARQSIFSRALAERALPYRGYVPDYVMGNAAMATMAAPYSGGRSYADLQRYNTMDDKLFYSNGKIAQTDVNTAVTVVLQLPLQTYKDGTATVSEIQKIRVLFPAMPYAASGESCQFAAYMDGPGNDYSLQYDGCLVSDVRYHYYVVGAESYNILEDRYKVYDLTDGKGNGIQLTAPLTIRFNTAAFNAVATLEYSVVYKQRQLTTAAYVAQRQHERGFNR